MTRNLRSFPFDPGRWPFFYGWVILGFGTAGMLMSVPGQTVGVSVFTDYLIEALGIPRNLLSLAYLVGTICSALLLTRAGRFYDRHGSRVMAVIASAGLGGVLVYLSFSDAITAAVHRITPFPAKAVIPFLITCLGFFLLRFMGQGSLTLASRNMVMQWFEKRRGLANGVLGAAVSFGFAISPRVLDGSIQRWTWQGAWRFLALVVGGGFALLAFVFFRNRPEDHGLVPDGGEITSSARSHPETVAARSFTLPEARGTFTFWVFTWSLLMSGLLVTAFTFHVVSIFETSGLTRARAVGIFLPASFVAVCAQFTGSYLSDYIKLKYVLLAHLAGMALLSLGVFTLREGAPVLLVIAGMGISQGLFGVNGNLTWARFFGRRYLGSVSGFATAWLVAGTAVGPYLFSLSLDLTGSYAPAALAVLVVVAVLMIGALRANRPE
ncbi:MAG: MFS transporter [Spirochaetota bacterium]